MLRTDLQKTHYSETEAAKALGISVDDLRTLIVDHIVDSADDLENVPKARFHPSDLLVLKLLSGLEAASTT